jgi:hypothetical protein
MLKQYKLIDSEKLPVLLHVCVIHNTVVPVRVCILLGQLGQVNKGPQLHSLGGFPPFAHLSFAYRLHLHWCLVCWWPHNIPPLPCLYQSGSSFFLVIFFLKKEK